MSAKPDSPTRSPQREISARDAKIVSLLQVLQAFIGAVALILLTWEIGWSLTDLQATYSEWATLCLVMLALVSEVGLALKNSKQSILKRRLILGALFVITICRFGLERPLVNWLGDYYSSGSATLIALLVIQITLIVPFAIRMLLFTRSKVLQFARPGTLFVTGFAAAIVVGTLLLKTPRATTNGISWIDAFFTSTSAICVTGLSVVDTEHAFTAHGQTIILLLIQVGGIGIMTLTYFMALMLGQGITLRDRAKLNEVFSEDNVGAMGKFVARIVVLTLVIEAVGAVLIYQSWQDAPARAGREWWDAVFHSVSAFCNAGFSTFSAGLADPAVATNRFLQTVIMLLIIAGGLGFAVLWDIPGVAVRVTAKMLRKFYPQSRKVQKLYLRFRIRLHTRLALLMTIYLVIGGAVFFFVAEGGEITSSRIWEATFNSVSTRTAGYNITNFGTYGFASVVLFCFLMFVGGSPGGTAGGVKTTTFAIAIAELWRLIRGHTSLHIHRRSIPRDLVERCIATVVMSLVWVTVSIFAVSCTNPNLDASDITFECFSAFATVGLTRGITAELNEVGKLIIIASMFVGRVGLFTLVISIVGAARPRRYDLPEAKFPLG